MPLLAVRCAYWSICQGSTLHMYGVIFSGAPAGRSGWGAASLLTRPRQTATRREGRASAGSSAPPAPATICDHICDQADEDAGRTVSRQTRTVTPPRPSRRRWLLCVPWCCPSIAPGAARRLNKPCTVAPLLSRRSARSELSRCEILRRSCAAPPAVTREVHACCGRVGARARVRAVRATCKPPTLRGARGGGRGVSGGGRWGERRTRYSSGRLQLCAAARPISAPQPQSTPKPPQ
eukprot:scaffold123153_cov66-Phaeocystis_antarctica.AAC.2